MITNILINSTTARITTNEDKTQNLSFNIDVPPIDISNNAILKVANFCHGGIGQTGYLNNIYLFKIRGVNVNNSKYIDNIGGNPTILAVNLNNNRGIYEENEIVLAKQTINNIDIVCETLNPQGILKSINVINGGSGYVKNQIFTPLITGVSASNIIAKVSSVNSGVIETIELINNGSSNYDRFIYANGSNAVLTATQSGGTINQVNILNAGIGYRQGQVLSFTGGGGSGAYIVIGSISTSGAITGITINSGGSGYTTNPTSVSIISTTTPSFAMPATMNGVGALLSATQTAGTINQVNILNAGTGYKVGQALTFTGGGGSSANITIATTGTEGDILTFTITSGGTGYTSNPTAVSITATAPTTLATITPNIEFGYEQDGIASSLSFCLSLRIEEDKDYD